MAKGEIERAVDRLVEQPKGKPLPGDDLGDREESTGTMSVGELRDTLQGVPDDLQVYISHETGPHIAFTCKGAVQFYYRHEDEPALFNILIGPEVDIFGD